MSTEPLRIYTDGACSGNGYKNAEAGVGVYFYPVEASLKPVSKRVKPEYLQSNNVAELFGVYYALKRLYWHCKPRHVHFYIDNQIALNTLLTTRKNGANWAIIQKIYYLRGILLEQGFTITGEWVHSHVKKGEIRTIHNDRNDLADILAKKSIGR
uniref:ribonuclease H n=1 Tax=viral metagenome TaxID=1070528 RepID=A0A6C0JWF4_9ZZZZ